MKFLKLIAISLACFSLGVFAFGFQEALFAPGDPVSDLNRLLFKNPFLHQAGGLDPYVMSVPSFTIIGQNKQTGENEVSESWSRTFIAEGYIWATAHSFTDNWASKNEEEKWADGDAVTIGEASIRGLIIDSERDAAPGDILYFNTITRKTVRVVIVAVDPKGKYADIFCNKPIASGDSGTPVLNVRTNKVVGMISGMYTYYYHPGDELVTVGYISLVKNEYNRLLKEKK